MDCVDFFSVWKDGSFGFVPLGLWWTLFSRTVLETIFMTFMKKGDCSWGFSDSIIRPFLNNPTWSDKTRFLKNVTISSPFSLAQTLTISITWHDKKPSHVRPGLRRPRWMSGNVLRLRQGLGRTPVPVKAVPPPLHQTWTMQGEFLNVLMRWFSVPTWTAYPLF